MKSLTHYPSLVYAKRLRTEGRVILVDEELSEEKRAEMLALKAVDGNELIFLEGKELSRDLETFLCKELQEKIDVLCVFPGNGANYPRQFLDICRKFPNVSVYAKRFWKPGIDPISTAGHILPDIFLVMWAKTVLVVDDVISSGMTMRKLYQNNAWRFTQAEWIGASWISQLPQMKAKSGVNGYERIITACLVEKLNGGKVPVNSLSTLRAEPEIAENYARRHFTTPDAFLRLL